MTFEYEKTVINHLKAAAIDGLLINESIDVETAWKRAGAKPVAFVSMGDEVASQAKDRAVLTELDIHVAIVMRGAVPEREGADAFFKEEVFQALHGEQLPGLQGALEWQGTLPSFEDGARIYQLTFQAKHVKRKR